MTLPDFICACGYRVNEAAFPADETQRPGPGDLAMCMNCGTVQEFMQPQLGTAYTSGTAPRLLPAPGTFQMLLEGGDA